VAVLLAAGLVAGSALGGQAMPARGATEVSVAATRDSGRVSGGRYVVGLELDPPAMVVPEAPTEILTVDSEGSARLVIYKYASHAPPGGPTRSTVTRRFRLAPASVAALTSEVAAVRSPALPPSYGQPLPDAGQVILSVNGRQTNIGANQAP